MGSFLVKVRRVWVRFFLRRVCRLVFGCRLGIGRVVG